MIRLDEMKELLGNEDEFIARVLEKFIQESGKDLKKLRAASGKEDAEMTRAIAHKMLSSTKIFGLDEISDRLEAVEVLAEENYDFNEISRLISGMELSWETVFAETKQIQRELLAVSDKQFD